MKKGDTVFYSVGPDAVRAVVRTVHRDGSVSIEAKFFQHEGADINGYLGYLYRVDASLLREVA